MKHGCMHPAVCAVMARARYAFEAKETQAMRASMITASKAGAAAGLNQYKTPDRLLREMHGMIIPPQQNPAMLHGINMEPKLLDKYEQVTGHKLIRDVGFMVDTVYPWLGCTPDGIVRDRPILVQGKCPYWNRMLSNKPIEAHYMVQLYVEMWVTGIRKTHFVRYVPAEYGFKEQIEIIEHVFDMQRWNNVIMPKLAAFWHRFTNEPRPPMSDYKEPRQKRQKKLDEYKLVI